MTVGGLKDEIERGVLSAADSRVAGEDGRPSGTMRTLWAISIVLAVLAVVLVYGLTIH